jgi:ADP-ribosylglycohydrolase
MRCIPTALAVTSRRRRISESIEISAITHDDERVVTACAAYNEIAAALVAGLGPAAAVAAGSTTARELGSTQVAGAIELGGTLRPAALAASGDLPFPGRAAGYVLDSLSLAVGAVLDERPLADIVVDVARLGNDTDTNAAIAGGLLGARDGAAAIPSRWQRLLQFGAEFTAAASALADLRTADVR